HRHVGVPRATVAADVPRRHSHEVLTMTTNTSTGHRHMMNSERRARAGRVVAWTFGAVAIGLALSCKDALKVSDPQNFSTENLDDPAILQAVANGVEGQFQQTYDDVIVVTELNSDEIEDTSTWIDWADISTGRLRGDWSTGGSFSAPQDELLRARFSAQDAA